MFHCRCGHSIEAAYLTLLPSPSLSVCLYLYRALDDSVLAKLQPVEQMEKMQKVLEAFQAQVQGLLLS